LLRLSLLYMKLSARHRRSLSLVFPSLHVQMLCGTNYGACWVKAIVSPYLVSLLAVSSLHLWQTSPVPCLFLLRQLWSYIESY
jgi:hypothetical protein